MREMKKISECLLRVKCKFVYGHCRHLSGNCQSEMSVSCEFLMEINVFFNLGLFCIRKVNNFLSLFRFFSIPEVSSNPMKRTGNENFHYFTFYYTKNGFTHTQGRKINTFMILLR